MNIQRQRSAVLQIPLSKNSRPAFCMPAADERQGVSCFDIFCMLLLTSFSYFMITLNSFNANIQVW